MCEYCNGRKALFNNRKMLSAKGLFKPGIEIFFEDELFHVISVLDTDSADCDEISLKVNYCPMCGKKLGD